MTTQTAKTIIFATSNHNKLRDVTHVEDQCGISLVTLSQWKALHPSLPEYSDVDETGTTYIENAKLKAEYFASWAGQAVVADDSGIEVEALDGRPGIHSARYARIGATAQENNEKLLKALKGITERSARMVSIWYSYLSPGVALVTQGEWHGEILESPRGTSGWGYEPLFYIPEYGKTIAELRDVGPLPFSHRLQAAGRMFELLSHLSHLLTERDNDNRRRAEVGASLRRER
jgi:non-canonical purine NTP pyrophosphatase (RdgB/HAM1 family)